MATILWRGDAPAVSQISTIVVGGTWVAADTATITINGKSITFTVGATATIAAVVAGLVAAWNASTVAEHSELTAADASPNLTLTADTGGLPFTATVSKSSASGTITISTTTANSGPSDAAILANYSPGAMPVNGDTLIFENSSNSCLYNLETLSALTTLTVVVKQSFTGTIGLPKKNAGGSYTEYRPRYFKAGISALAIGSGTGNGSARLMFDAASSNPAVTISGSGTGSEKQASGIPAVLIIGTGATSTLSITQGELGLAFFGGETAAFATVNVGYESSQNNDSWVVCGSGASIGVLNQTGGDIALESNLTTLKQEGGTLEIGGTAVMTTATIGGTLYDDSSGTFSTVAITAAGVYDHRQSVKAKTITNKITMEDGAAFHDPYQLVTASAGWECEPEKVTLNIGRYSLAGAAA